MEIVYKTDVLPEAEQVSSLYDKAGLTRPTKDRERIRLMVNNAGLVVTAWDGDTLVGIVRCITDWVWCCYLSDLAVDPAYQKVGIGRQLLDLTKARVGEQVMLLLLSVPDAMDYYPKVGFTKDDRAFTIKRIK